MGIGDWVIDAFVEYRHLDDICILYCIFSLEEQKNNKIDINSLKIIAQEFIYIDFLKFNQYGRFYFIQTKRGKFYLSFVTNENKLFFLDQEKKRLYYISTLTNEYSFQKLILIKDEIKMLCYYSSDKYLVFIIFDEIYYEYLNKIIESRINKFLPFLDDNDYSDIIFISEVKAVFAFDDSTNIAIYLLNFFNNYKKYVMSEFILNIYGNKINNYCIYSLLFKYKNMLGIQFKNSDFYGFILFGYFNSTDPKQILNIKKDGLNYKINLGNYLNLQSNIFEYEIKCVRIINLSVVNESGIYLVSNITKNYIRKNDCLDINTGITLYFSYNGTLKKGNYLFKFVRVLQEPKFKAIQNNSEQIYWNTHDNNLKEKYIKEYNERRNMDITGRVALV